VAGVASFAAVRLEPAMALPALPNQIQEPL